MNILNIANQRYSCKKFDPDYQLTAEQTQQIKDLLRLSPSSINSQPWHFILATTPTGKARLAKAASQGAYKANQPKILDSSATIIFCAKTEFSDQYLSQIIKQEAQDGRIATQEDQEKSQTGRSFYVNLHRQNKDTQCWIEKQVYLNLGNFLLGIAGLGLDAVPIEGIDTEILETELQLAKQGYKPLVAVALGKKSQDDFNANLPKSRWKENQIITQI